MRSFAKQFIERNHASHVIFFDNKAVCCGGCFLLGKDKKFDDVLYVKGWRAFKRHEHLFPHPNFLFEEQCSEDDGCCGYYKLMGINIINKHSLEKCLDQHLDLFKEALGEEFDCRQFIAKLENGSSLGSLTNEDEMLLGILLGFGEESSKTFKDVQSNCTTLFALPSWTETYRGIDLKRPRGCKIYPLAFMGNPQSREVQDLVSMYEKELDEFWNIYQNEDPLELFLKCICSDSSK